MILIFQSNPRDEQVGAGDFTFAPTFAEIEFLRHGFQCLGRLDGCLHPFAVIIAQQVFQRAMRRIAGGAGIEKVGAAGGGLGFRLLFVKWRERAQLHTATLI